MKQFLGSKEQEQNHHEANLQKNKKDNYYPKQTSSIHVATIFLILGTISFWTHLK